MLASAYLVFELCLGVDEEEANPELLLPGVERVRLEPDDPEGRAPEEEDVGVDRGLLELVFGLAFDEGLEEVKMYAYGRGSRSGPSGTFSNFVACALK